jgi:hypothetical protein
MTDSSRQTPLTASTLASRHSVKVLPAKLAYQVNGAEMKTDRNRAGGGPTRRVATLGLVL